MTMMSSSECWTNYFPLMVPVINFSIYRFVTHSLRSPDQALQPDSIDQEESKKFESEFQKFQQQDKEQKDAWVKEHPDAAKKMEMEEDEWMDGIFEDDNIRELKQIFQGQSSMNEVMRDLHRKMDEIIGRQERALSVLTNIQNSGVRGGGGAPVQGGAMPAIDTIRRDEVNAVLANQRELVSAARDIKNFVTDVHSKVSNIQQTQARGQGSVQTVGGSQQAGSGDLDMATQGYQGGRGSHREQGNSHGVDLKEEKPGTFVTMLPQQRRDWKAISRHMRERTGWDISIVNIIPKMRTTTR